MDCFICLGISLFQWLMKKHPHVNWVPWVPAEVATAKFLSQLLPPKEFKGWEIITSKSSWTKAFWLLGFQHVLVYFEGLLGKANCLKEKNRFNPKLVASGTFLGVHSNSLTKRLCPFQVVSLPKINMKSWDRLRIGFSNSSWIRWKIWGEHSRQSEYLTWSNKHITISLRIWVNLNISPTWIFLH